MTRTTMSNSGVKSQPPKRALDQNSSYPPPAAKKIDFKSVAETEPEQHDEAVEEEEEGEEDIVCNGRVITPLAKELLLSMGRNIYNTLLEGMGGLDSSNDILFEENKGLREEVEAFKLKMSESKAQLQGREKKCTDLKTQIKEKDLVIEGMKKTQFAVKVDAFLTATYKSKWETSEKNLAEAEKQLKETLDLLAEATGVAKATNPNFV